MANELSFLTNNYSETALLGKRLSKVIEAGDLIFLKGDLGSGKTTFMRGVLRGLDFNGKVKSPSYTLLEQYNLKLDINHFDLYRFKSQNEWDEAGFNEFIDNFYVNFIEWPEKAIDLIPEADITIVFSHINIDTRKIMIMSNSDRGVKCIKALS